MRSRVYSKLLIYLCNILLSGSILKIVEYLGDKPKPILHQQQCTRVCKGAFVSPNLKCDSSCSGKRVTRLAEAVQEVAAEPEVLEVAQQATAQMKAVKILPPSCCLPATFSSSSTRWRATSSKMGEISKWSCGAKVRKRPMQRKAIEEKINLFYALGVL